MPTRATPAEQTRAEGEQYDMETRQYGVKEVLRLMLPLATPHKRPIAAAMVLIVFAAACMAAMPLIGKVFIDWVLPAGSVPLALLMAGGFILIGLIRVNAWYWGNYILLFVGEAVVFAMRQRGFRHVQRLCLRFHSKYPSGFLYNRMFEQAINRMGVFFRMALTNIIVWIVGLALSLVICVMLSWLMTAVIVVGAAGYVLAARKLGPRIRRRTQTATNAHNWIAGFILDRMRGTKTIQAYSMEDRVQEEFDEKVWPMQKQWIAAQREMMKLRLLTEGIGFTVNATVWVVGAVAAFKLDMRVGTIVAFVTYQTQLTHIVNMLTNMWGQFASARAGFDLYQTVMDTDSTVVDRPTRDLPEPLHGRLRFENVTFAYEEEPVLRGLDLTIDPGHTVALVGRSGAGKTTLANLLLRFYDPNEGRILLDGIDIRELPLRKYRALYGVVLQEPFLFDDSIANNLRSARPQADETQMRQALADALALEFVEALPHGIDTAVGEGGSRLSGGQRQRIAIARCMLLDPKFLLLDEATSALDNETERDVQAALNKLFEDRTAFVIAHRLSTIRRASRILVFDGGQVGQDGEFDELVARKGLFRYLYSIATSTSSRDTKIDEAGFA